MLGESTEHNIDGPGRQQRDSPESSYQQRLIYRPNGEPRGPILRRNADENSGSKMMTLKL